MFTAYNSTIAANAAPATAGGQRGIPGRPLPGSGHNGPGHPGEGGGVYVYSPGSASAVSTIFGDNEAAVGPDFFGAFDAAANTLLEDGSGATGITSGVNGNLVGVDPRLGPLADNGGPTPTHALLPGSPALDAGSNPLGLSADQRGF